MVPLKSKKKVLLAKQKNDDSTEVFVITNKKVLKGRGFYDNVSSVV